MRQPDLEMQLAFLAMRFRSSRDESKRREVAREYASVVDRLIAGGKWTEHPSFEEMLPREWMSGAFFQFWT